MLFRPLIIAISMFCIGLGPLLPDLPKIPAIWGHYQHHVREHGENDLSFVEYLVDHFTGFDHQDDEHAQLPMHSVPGCAGASGGVYVGVCVETDVKPYCSEPTRQTYTTSSAKPSSPTTSKTVKPPRS